MPEKPTTGADAPVSAARSPGTARIGPMDTTGLLGATRIRSAAPIASATPAAGRASSIPTMVTASAAGWARSRTQYSWKCTARRPPGAASSAMVMCVSTRSSVIGSSRRSGSPASHRPARAAVTSESG